MDKTYRILTALLLSFVIVASIIMFTVGLEQSHLGPERKWMYPLFLSSYQRLLCNLGLGFCSAENPKAAML